MADDPAVKPQWFWCATHGDFAIKPQCPHCEHDAATWRQGIERIRQLLAEFNITDTDILKHTLEDHARWRGDLMAGRLVESPSTADAVDPSAPVPGTPSTRD